jgi:hypothetical protein
VTRFPRFIHTLEDRRRPQVILTIHVDPSWLVHAEALGRILDHVRALEAPAPYVPRPVREPGDDGDDLAELLSGMDTPELPPVSAPARHPAAKPGPAPSTSVEARPATGQALYRYAADRKILPRVNAIGKRNGYARLITGWTPEQVAVAYAELTREPAAVATGHPR